MRLPNIILVLGLAFPLPALADPAPPVRTFGDLTVDDPPRARSEDPRGRMLGDVEGSLQVGAPRRWVGPPVPLGVPLGFGSLELLRLLPTDGGVLALYREPFARGPGEPGCAATQMWQNCKQEARFYRTDGSVAWRLDFTARFPRPDHLVVFDTLLDGQTLYYNESCQTYAKDAGRQVRAAGRRRRVRSRAQRALAVQAALVQRAHSQARSVAPHGLWVHRGKALLDGAGRCHRQGGANAARAQVAGSADSR